MFSIGAIIIHEHKNQATNINLLVAKFYFISFFIVSIAKAQIIKNTIKNKVDFARENPK